MDVGFNNTNTLHLALGEKELEDVVWLVEANSNEAHQLWADWSEQSITNFKPIEMEKTEADALIVKAYSSMSPREAEKIRLLVEMNTRVLKYGGKRKKWKQIPAGHSFTIIELECKPTNGIGPVQTLAVRIDFRYFVIDGFKIAFYSSNAIISHRFYVEAFLKTYFQRTHDNYTRWNHTDAQNFHNCINYLDTLDKNPRETSYKPDEFMHGYFVFEPIDLEKIR